MWLLDTTKWTWETWAMATISPKITCWMNPPRFCQLETTMVPSKGSTSTPLRSTTWHFFANMISNTVLAITLPEICIFDFVVFFCRIAGRKRRCHWIMPDSFPSSPTVGSHNTWKDPTNEASKQTTFLPVRPKTAAIMPLKGYCISY